jgi:hypothetical protein
MRSWPGGPRPLHEIDLRVEDRKLIGEAGNALGGFRLQVTVSHDVHGLDGTIDGLRRVLFIIDMPKRIAGGRIAGGQIHEKVPMLFN